jgi:hypothetical protein
MKLFLALFALMLTSSSFAMSLACVTEFPTTTVYGEEKGDEFVVTVYHHNGTGYMPLHSGIITPNDLPQMAEKAEDFARLGELYEFRYDLKDCFRIDEDIMSCNNGKTTEINGVKVRPFSLFTKRVVTEFDLAKFEETEVSFLMDVENKTRFLSMKYMKNECYQSKKAQTIMSVIGK